MTTDLTSGLDTAAFSSVIKPSDDLFRFVNGPWIDTYRLPDDKARYGSFDKLAEDAESQIRDILEDEDCPAAKSQALYRSFMDTDAIEAAGATPIRPALDAIDHAADKAALTRTIGALKPIDMGPDVFDIAVFGDPKNPDTNVVHLEQSGIGLPDEAYYREDHYAPIREAYVDMVAKQLRLAGYGDEETTRAQADRFLGRDPHRREPLGQRRHARLAEDLQSDRFRHAERRIGPLRHRGVGRRLAGRLRRHAGGEDPAGGPDGRAAAHHRPRAQLPQGLRRLLEQR